MHDITAPTADTVLICIDVQRDFVPTASGTESPEVRNIRSLVNTVRLTLTVAIDHHNGILAKCNGVVALETTIACSDHPTAAPVPRMSR